MPWSSAPSASPRATCWARSSARRWRARGVRGGAPPGPGQHRHPRAGARQRRGRRLPRVHRHHRARAAEAQPGRRAAADAGRAERWLAPRGLKAAVPLGFNNTYALAMREADAARLGVSHRSDLRACRRRRGPAARACRTNSWRAPTAGRRCSAAYALPFGRRRRRWTTAWPTRRWRRAGGRDRRLLAPTPRSARWACAC